MWVDNHLLRNVGHKLLELRGAYDNPFFVWAFKIAVDS